jgi:predicted ATP-grasp superfamily ATP-dependent carboligase
LSAFGGALAAIVKSHQIALLVPTCEEVFFISWHRSNLRNYCDVFCDDFEKLRSLHSKWTFLGLARDCGVSIPESFHLKSMEDLRALPDEPGAFVFKPEYSRFASHTLVSPNYKELALIHPSAAVPWLAQRRIHGKEFCSYSIAEHGRLRAHACYHPAYRVGLGSGVFFDPVRHEGILEFVSNFTLKTRFHGQLGFDFIESDDGSVFVLECNPRATSGAHMFTPGDQLPAAFLGAQAPLIVAKPPRPRMVAPAMVLFNFLIEARRGKLAKALRRYSEAQDVCFAVKDPWPSLYQFAGLAEVMFKSVVRRIGLKEAATSDIEWNGEELA